MDDVILMDTEKKSSRNFLRDRLASMVAHSYNQIHLKPTILRSLWGKKRGFEALGRK
jgi:hypothetical protein